MAFFSDLKKGITVTGQTVAQKTKEIGETVQVKSQINTEKETITRLYAAIGKQIFEAANEESEKKFFTEFASIRKAMNKIEELEATLTGMDGCIFCSECGARIEKNSKFCSKCGKPVDQNKIKVGEAVADALRGKSSYSDVVEAEYAAESVTADVRADYVANRYV